MEFVVEAVGDLVKYIEYIKDKFLDDLIEYIDGKI